MNKTYIEMIVDEDIANVLLAHPEVVDVVSSKTIDLRLSPVTAVMSFCNEFMYEVELDADRKTMILESAL